MAASKNKTPDFFEDEPFDPVDVATGPGGPARSEKPSALHAGRVLDPGPVKKKVGFYVSVDLLERFTRKFYELKLAGAAIENKSALLELALTFALDDLDTGTKSQVLKLISKA